MTEEVPKRIGFGFLVIILFLQACLGLPDSGSLKTPSVRAALTTTVETSFEVDKVPYTKDVAEDVANKKQGKEVWKNLLVAKAKAEGLEDPDVKTLSAIIQAESGWRQFEKDGTTPLRGRVHPEDIGLCQINTASDAHGPELDSSKLDVRNADDNLDFCIKLYRREGIRPWRASEPNWRKILIQTT